MSVGDDYAGRDDEGRDGEADKSLQFTQARTHTHRRKDVCTGFFPTNFKALALLECESLNFYFTKKQKPFHFFEQQRFK